ncbi:hypothetical protein [Nonomuraea zeae]|uniref:Uncharacterized protein n=1 Tax=Nonomuraea zeae TaxID=1642303 RepID=A0A5S4G8K3_9ACTN|nr:hypothetical protein [Nonomuraea zeae]TMR29347.1 hypothetical protein ETD85_32745 [Nonomuraea zeae]
MRHMESDLRQLLTRQMDERAGGEPAPNLGAIVRRGRRIRRVRRMAAAGAAVAAAVTAAMLVTDPVQVKEAIVAQRPVDSVRVRPGPRLPEKYEVVLGAKRYDLPLLHSERFETVGVERTVTFDPVSLSTGHKVACEDPRAWVVVVGKLKGGETGGETGRCGPASGGHHDRLSAPAGWLERPQTLRIWVFPADAPVREVAEAVTGCPPVGKSKECDETAQSVALMNPEVRERLSAEVGERPGAWAAGIYDGPAGDQPVRR